MEPESSLPHSQVPANCPYPEPHRSSPYPHIPRPEDPSYYYPAIYVWVFHVFSLPHVSPRTLAPSIRYSLVWNWVLVTLLTLRIGGF